MSETEDREKQTLRVRIQAKHWPESVCVCVYVYVCTPASVLVCAYMRVCLCMFSFIVSPSAIEMVSLIWTEHV